MGFKFFSSTLLCSAVEVVLGLVAEEEYFPRVHCVSSTNCVLRVYPLHCRPVFLQRLQDGRVSSIHQRIYTLALK